MSRRVDQWVPALHRGDAIGDSAMLMREALRSWGFRSDIYTYNQDPGLDAIPFAEWREGGERDVVLFHYALISPMNDAFGLVRGHRVLQYHNLTPPHFFAAWDSEISRILTQGLQGLAPLAKHATLGLGDSEFNRQDLVRLGFTRTGVLPIAIDESRYAGPGNPVLLRRLSDGRVNLLFVGRVAPNKGHDQLLRLLALYKRHLSPAVRLLAVGKHPRRETGDGRAIEAHYLDALVNLAADLGLDPSDAIFTDGVTHDDLLACYASAHVFVSMSEHEGFGVPLVEAMIRRVPIVALGGTAVSETLGGAGVVFAHKDLPGMAEAAAALAVPGPAREAVLRAQDLRARDFARETTLGRLRRIVEGLA